MKARLLEGKTAIITGANEGIGAAIAELFAEEGAAVVITDIHQEGLDREVEKIRSSGGKAVGVLADQSDAGSVPEVFETAKRAFGDIDILVVNAATADCLKIEAEPDEVWEEMMAVNLTGPFRYAREAMRHFLPKNEGRIIFISSVVALRTMDGLAYCTSKGGLNTMARHIATHSVGTGIRVNTICPGSTITSLRNLVCEPSDDPSKQEEFDPMKLQHRLNPPENISTRPALMSRTVRKYTADPIDQAYAALFFASEMSNCIHGQVLTVDNGCFL